MEELTSTTNVETSSVFKEAPEVEKEVSPVFKEVTPKTVSTIENVDDKFKDLEFDEYGYVKDPSKVKDGVTAKLLWEQGKMTKNQVKESKAHKLLSNGLLYVDMDSANILYDKGVITDEQFDELKEYHESPISWYIKDTAKQVVGGARDFTQETMETMFKLHNDFDLKLNIVKWLADVEDKDVAFPESQKLPEIEKSQSAVGQATRGVTQFLSGFIPLYGQMNKVNQGRTLVNGMTAGAITDFIGFDEHEKRLSDLVQSVPELQNPITEYLQSDKSDSMYEGKLKNTLEGLGLGAIIDGALLGLKAVKSNLWAKHAGDEVEVTANIKDITGKTIDEVAIKPNEPEVPIKQSTDETQESVNPVIEGVSKIAEGTNPNIIDEITEAVSKNIDPKVVDDVVSSSTNAIKGVEDTISKATQNINSQMGSQASEEAINKPITEVLITAEDVEKMIQYGMKSETVDIPSQSHIVTKRLADEFGYDFDKSIFGLSKDVEYLAPRVHSAMRMLDNYTEQLKAEIKSYLDETGDNIKPNLDKGLDLFDKIKFHGNLQKTVRGISANIGRALNAHQIKIGEKFVDFKNVSRADKDDLLRSMGGESNIHQTIKTFYDLLENGSKRDINRYTKQLSQYKFSNFLHGTWLSGILSGIGTQVVNLTGNTMNIALESLEHTLAVSGRSFQSFRAGEGIDSLRHFNEVQARVRGMGQGFIDAFRFFKFDEDGALKLESGTFWKVLKDNEPILDPKLKIEDNVTHNMPTYFSKGRADREEFYKTMGGFERNMNRTVGVLGDVITLPLRFLSATDEAFKSISYKAEIMRSAVEEANNRGLKGERAKAFMKRYVEEPSPAVHQRALDVARDMTFTRAIDTENTINGALNPTRRFLSNAGVGVDKVASTITSMKHTPFIQHPMRYLVPFITTPLNIVKHVARRSPLAMFSRRWQEDILAGGTRRAQAYSKLFTGVGVTMAISEMYDRGLITGKIPKINEEGFKMLEIPDYSIKIGDKWVDYSRLDPIAMMVGLVTDVKSALSVSETDEAKSEEIWSMTTMALMNNMVNKTYMKGISDFINMVNDPVRYKPEDYFANLVSSMVPYSSAFQQYNNSEDPFYREAKTINEYVRKKYAPETLPPKLDIFGDPIKRTPKLMMAFENNEITDDEVLREIFKVGANIGESNDKLEFEETTIELDIREHNQFKKLIGKTGVKEHIRQLINSEGYKAIEDYEVRASLIKRVYSNAKKQAKYDFIKANPRYKDKVMADYELKGDRIYDAELSEPANRKYHPIPALKKIAEEINNDK